MGKRGPKPTSSNGEAKQSYKTKLPTDQIAFLRSLPNAAAWLQQAIEAQRAKG